MDAKRRLDPRSRADRAWPARLACALATCSLLSCGGEPPPALSTTERVADGRAQRTVSLVRLAGEEAKTGTWNLRRDHRVGLVHEAPGSLRIPKVLPGKGCVLDFGYAIDPQRWRTAPAVEMRIEIRGERGSGAVFRKLLDPSAIPPAWQDTRVALGSLAEAPYELIFEARLSESPSEEKTKEDAEEAAREPADEESKPLRVAWSAPHVVCDAAEGLAPAAGPPDVLLVSLDTLRRDHLGLYGYPRPTSPALDALAAEGVVFEMAFATAPWTLPSHASMLTGLYPDEHGAGHAAPFVPLSDHVPTLAETLASHGYRTIAFTGGGVMTRSRGLARGFEEWHERPRANLRSVLPEVLDVLSQREDARPLFLFLHTYDIHGPYDQPPEERRFRSERQPPRSAAARDERLRARASWAEESKLEPHRYLEPERYRDLFDLVAAYDDGIRFVDAQLGVLFQHMRRLGALERTLVIVTSDHGEAFLEHGVYVGHSYLLFDEELRIPLIVRLPGPPQPGRGDELVDLSDLAAIVYDVTGVPAPARLSGTNPLARIAGRLPSRTWVRGEASHTGSRYARSNDWTLVTETLPLDAKGMRLSKDLHDRFDTGEQIYDLRGDPGQRSALADAAAPGLARLRAALADTDAPARAEVDEILDRRGEITEEFAEQLRALGYIE